jgi:hypothetical protein
MCTGAKTCDGEYRKGRAACGVGEALKAVSAKLGFAPARAGGGRMSGAVADIFLAVDEPIDARAPCCS